MQTRPLAKSKKLLRKIDYRFGKIEAIFRQKCLIWPNLITCGQNLASPKTSNLLTAVIIQNRILRLEVDKMENRNLYIKFSPMTIIHC